MTIAELRESSNKALSRVPGDLLVAGVVILSSTAAFGLGMLAERERGAGKGDGFWVEELATTSAALPAAAATAPKAPVPMAAVGAAVAPAAGKYVASKSGTKYYLPTCSGAARIKESNKVWFASAEEAQAAGFGPASNCPGL